MAVSMTSTAKKNNLDSLYKCLDEAISNSSEYVRIRETRISDLKRQLNETADTEDKYSISYRLFNEYKPYCNDSAMAYISRCIAMAEKTGDRRRVNRCRITQAFQCSSTGMYVEAFEIMADVDTSALDRKGLGEYYMTYNHIYGEVGYYARVREKQKSYNKKAAEYQKKMMAILDENDDSYLQHLEMDYIKAGRPKDAVKVNDMRMRNVSPDSREFAIIAFYRYLDYKRLGDKDMCKYWLVRSAISDVRHAVMDQASMWELANLLSEDERELKRSYQYICFGWKCAEFFGTRLRSIQVSSVFSTIEYAYQAASIRKTNLLRLMVTAVSILALLTLMLLLYVNRQRKRLAQAKHELSDKNEELLTTNGQLSLLNSQLSHANSDLKESNKIKEEYIGRFMRICSMYVDRMDNMRKRINKMVKNREYEEIYKMTRMQEFKEKELGELYSDFDMTFLHLYPNFVDDFNALLREEERIVLPDKKTLNTAIRIFALIRLGIEDSSKIAEFLHYSVNTIYNYRARVKNGALKDRENFEKYVKQIGMPS